MIKFSNILKEIKITPHIGMDWKNASVRRVIAKSYISVFQVNMYYNLIDLGSYYTLMPSGDHEDILLIPKEWFEDLGEDKHYWGKDETSDQRLIKYIKELYDQGKYKVIDKNYGNE